MTRSELNRRRDDIETAIRNGHTYAWLAGQWGTSICSTTQWVGRNATDVEIETLRRTGNALKGPERKSAPEPRHILSPLTQRDLDLWRGLGGQSA